MSALADYRTDRFKQRQLTFVVTPSEYNKFVEYNETILPGCYDTTYIPDPILQSHACLFYRTTRGMIVWHDPDDLNVPDDMPAARIPFALLEYNKSNSDALDLAAEIQSRLRTIENDVQFVSKALETLAKLIRVF